MNYAGMKEYDISNGPGIRFSFFVSGCRHHCPGCFNPETWDFNYGKPYKPETEDYIIEQVSQEFYDGMTFLGGEPLEPKNQVALLPLARRYKKVCPKKTLWCFTGFLLDKDIFTWMIKEVAETKELLQYIDVLVDGPFVMAKKDINLLFKGSSNQRTIDMKKTLANHGEIVFWNPYGVSMSERMKI